MSNNEKYPRKHEVGHTAGDKITSFQSQKTLECSYSENSEYLQNLLSINTNNSTTRRTERKNKIWRHMGRVIGKKKDVVGKHLKRMKLIVMNFR